eukprot:GHVP01026782.1.p1 GENE.GHVP01026782.1~~GHVP01026782.1.p1  ORF type:complete len:268 (+),score=49.26 GHVP01026782.1:533-1336(+)
MLNWSDRRVLSAVLAGSFQFGITLSLFNVIWPHYVLRNNWCDGLLVCASAESTKAALGPLMMVAAAIGSFAVAPLIQKSRKLAWIVTSLGFIFSGLGYVTATSPAVVLFARMVHGLCAGFTTSLPSLFISEVTPEEKMGSRGTGHQLGVTTGIMLPILIGSLLPVAEEKMTLLANHQLVLAIVLGLPAIFGVAGLILFGVVFPGETPAYYVKNFAPPRALEQLKEMYGPTKGAEELDILLEEEEQAQARSVVLRLVYWMCSVNWTTN